MFIAGRAQTAKMTELTRNDWLPCMVN